MESFFCKIANFPFSNLCLQNFSDYAQPEITIWGGIVFRIITFSPLDRPELKIKQAKVDLKQFMETIPFCYTDACIIAYRIKNRAPEGYIFLRTTPYNKWQNTVSERVLNPRDENGNVKHYRFYSEIQERHYITNFQRRMIQSVIALQLGNMYASKQECIITLKHRHSKSHQLSQKTVIDPI